MAVVNVSSSVAVADSVARSAELVDRIAQDAPVVATMPPREQLVIAAWLMSLRSPRTRKSYANDVAQWLTWCTERGVDLVTAHRVDVDMWIQNQADMGAENSTLRRRLSALSSLYKYCVAHDLAAHTPTQGVRRPYVDPDYTKTVGLSREESRHLIAAADSDTGKQHLRSAAIVRLLLHNGLRVDELSTANLADLTVDRGHAVLTITRKGSGREKVALAAPTLHALTTYLDDRATRLGVTRYDLKGPLFVTSTGKPLTQITLWRLIRRLAKTAEIATWQQLSPHSLRHSAITHFLDAGGTMRDAQDYAGHKDPRTTRRYDRSRGHLDRHGAYTVAAYLAE